MSLSCSCGEDGDYFYFPPEDFTPFDGAKRKRCCSCKALIEKGALSLKFETGRNPFNDIEERIHGDIVHLADKFMCEPCGDQYFNLSELGFCIEMGENVMELLEEYQKEYSKPMKAA